MAVYPANECLAAGECNNRSGPEEHCLQFKEEDTFLKGGHFRQRRSGKKRVKPFYLVYIYENNRAYGVLFWISPLIIVIHNVHELQAILSVKVSNDLDMLLHNESIRCLIDARYYTSREEESSIRMASSLKTMLVRMYSLYYNS